MRRLCMRLLFWTFCALFPLGLACAAEADKPAAKPVLSVEQSLADNLAGLIGKPVTLHLKSGQTVSGQVGGVKDGRVLLTRLAGKEFFDALASIDDVIAVEVKVR